MRRIVYEKGMTLDNAIKKSGISKSLGLPEWPEAGKADASAEPCVLFRYRGTVSESRPRANCRDAEGSQSAEEQWERAENDE